MPFSSFGALQSLTQEYDYRPLEVTGEIPEDLSGILYRVGVGEYSAYGQRLPHWFDGCGMMLGISIHRGEVKGASRILNGIPDYEKKAGELLLGRFGIAPKGLIRRIRSLFEPELYVNAANTSPMVWQDRLFALWEGGLPTEVSTDGFNRIGPTNFDGRVRRSFSAHPKRVDSRKSLYNFGVRFVPRPQIDLYHLPDEGMVHELGSIPYHGSAFLHDFAASENHLCFFSPPVFLDLKAMLIRGDSLASSMRFRPDHKSQITIVPIDQPQNYFQLEAPPFFATHIANGYEKDGKFYSYIIL